MSDLDSDKFVARINIHVNERLSISVSVCVPAYSTSLYVQGMSNIMLTTAQNEGFIALMFDKTKWVSKLIIYDGFKGL